MSNQCIYCKNEINTDSRSREHTFPRSFGCPDDWILRCVCKFCNNKFGRLEQWLAYDSAEGLYRLTTLGSRSSSVVSPRRLRLTIPNEERFSHLKGAVVHIDSSLPEQILLPAQVGFLNESGIREFFTEAEIESDYFKAKIDSLKKENVMIFALEQEDFKRLSGLLVCKSILPEFNTKREESIEMQSLLNEDSELIMDVKATIDRDIKRVYAKIALNYVAKIEGPDFVLDNKFGEIREYINGNTKGDYVKISQGPVFPFETMELRTVSGHFFIFCCDNMNRLMGKVSLFYHRTGLSYDVTLCQKFSKIWCRLAKGHIFNVEHKSFSEITFVPDYRKFLNNRR